VIYEIKLDFKASFYVRLRSHC